jgi:phosphatidylinositol glycan class S
MATTEKISSSQPVATSKHKLAPPLTTSEVRTRQYVVLSFWAVIFFLGLPIWWRTTTVYRANLPLSEMTAWADGKICRPTFPLRVAVDAPSISAQDVQHLIKTTQHVLDDLNEFSAHHLRLVLAEDVNMGGMVDTVATREGEAEEIQHVKDDIALLVRLKSTTNSPTPASELRTYSPVLDVYYSPNQVPTSSSSVSPLASHIAKELQSIFSEEQAVLAHMLSTTPWGSANTNKMSHGMTEALIKRSTRSFKYAPTYHLTFSLFTPTSIPSDWDIEAALQEHIKPLLQSLSLISNFTIDTQVQMYATFSPSTPEPEYNTDTKTWNLKKDDLSGFVNAAEWPLSPSIGSGPTINFIVYVPAPHQTPLIIRETGANSWLIPQWGGIQIFNPSDKKTPDVLNKNHLEPIMATFTAQLLSLLGLPHSPKSLPVRLATLTRLHTASLLFSTSSTLGALARLTRTLPSIAIPNTVASSVDLTIAHLNAACSSMREGNFHAALQNARIAETEAESAFFERSMVGQVYFPDEHKVAVYLPLLGPVAVPLVMSAVKEIKRWRGMVVD